MQFLASVSAYLRQFNFPSVFLRLVIAMGGSGVIGYGRARKKRAAGFRTYMLISIGAALTILLASYEYEMLTGPWAPAVEIVGMKFDSSRYASQVVSGIGFLGAGTILATTHKQVSGLSTATGLFASACMGMAAGAGFYECVLVTVFMVVLALDFMYPVESAFKRRIRNITLYVEFDSIENVSEIIDVIQKEHAQVFDVDLERTKKDSNRSPSAVFDVKLGKGYVSHSGMLSSIAEISCVHSIQELIS